MIEVLVSLTIVAFGVLGLLGLQARALSFQKDSFDRRTAAEMVAQLSERIRANHMGLVNGDYNTATAPLYHLHPTTLTPVTYTACVGTGCTARQIRLFATGLNGSPSFAGVPPVRRPTSSGMARPTHVHSW